MVEKDVSQCGLALRRVEGTQVDPCGGECVVGGCEYRERALALEGRDQLCLRERGNQGCVDGCGLCSHRDIHCWSPDVGLTLLPSGGGVGHVGKHVVASSERHSTEVGVDVVCVGGHSSNDAPAEIVWV